MTLDTMIEQEKNAIDPTDPYARQGQIFPKLTQDQIERMKPFGQIDVLAKGSVLFERGDRTVDFFVILQGAIEIYEHRRDGINVFTTHSENQFTGEIDLFNNRKILVGGRMACDGQVLRIERERFKRLLTAEPDISEIVMRAFILRRVALISHAQASATLLYQDQSADTIRIERFLRRNGYPVELLHCGHDDCEALMHAHNLTKEDLPAVLVHLGEQIVKNPSNYQLAECLGLDEEIDMNKTYDVVIVGGGPAGLSAAVYAASEGLTTVLLEQEAPGGQASTSSKIENYLGFPTGLSGQALAGRAQLQAMKFGAQIVLPYMVKSIDCKTYPFNLKLCSQGTIKARAVVVASGARYRTLNLDNARAFDNAGVHYAATPMEANLCKNEEVIIVGGGNSAGQAAVFLSKHAKHVHIIVRGPSLAASMSEYLIDRIDASPKITLHAHTEITKLEGDTKLERVEWSQNNKKEMRDIRHIFLMIGAVPHTDWLQNCIQMDPKGFICTGSGVDTAQAWRPERAPMMLESSQPGIFAAGDVRSGSIKRVASAVGEGAMSVSHVHGFLAERAEQDAAAAGKEAA